MSNTILIGLGSKARIGKDFAAQELAKTFDVERIAFADKLKADLAKIFESYGMDYHKLESNSEDKAKLRPLLVEYGMTMRRFNENHWVDHALQNREFNAQVTIITDVRFPNEAKRLQELGGYYIEIKTTIPPANETEAYYSPLMEGLADFTITNNFDRNYIGDLLRLIPTLDSISNRLWKQTLSGKSKVTSSTEGNISSSMLDQNQSFQRKS